MAERACFVGKGFKGIIQDHLLLDIPWRTLCKMRYCCFARDITASSQWHCAPKWGMLKAGGIRLCWDNVVVSDKKVTKFSGKIASLFIAPWYFVANIRMFRSHFLSFFIVFQKPYYFIFYHSMHAKFRNVGLHETSYITTCCHMQHYYVSLFISH